MTTCQGQVFHYCFSKVGFQLHLSFSQVMEILKRQSQHVGTMAKSFRRPLGRAELINLTAQESSPSAINLSIVFYQLNNVWDGVILGIGRMGAG
jgi:hypothetical protein